MDDVQLVNITQALSKLHETQKQKKATTQASLFTLIIYVHEEQRRKYLREIVQNVIEKYPCRIIFITADRDPESSHFHVEVSAAENNKGGVLICCDQINIEVGHKYIKRVPFLILPHIITDLPVYLLWGQDAVCENEVLPTLEKLADRLIFDAECTSNLKNFSQKILEKSKSLDLELLDINWGLTSSWREILSQVFYLPEHLQQLVKSKSINIIYNCLRSDWIQQPEVQSIYIEAWMATRLGWQLDSMIRQNGERLFTYTGKESDIQIKLVPKLYEDLPPGGIVSFSLHSVEGYHFLLERHPTQPKVTINCSSEVMCELPYSLPQKDTRRGFTFMTEVFYSIPSHHYIEVLEHINKIDWQ